MAHDPVDARHRAAFSGRRFEVASEFHLRVGQVAQTMFGNRVRHGYVIRDVDSGERLVIGVSTLKLLADRFEAVTIPAKVQLVPVARE